MISDVEVRANIYIQKENGKKIVTKKSEILGHISSDILGFKESQ